MSLPKTRLQLSLFSPQQAEFLISDQTPTRQSSEQTLHSQPRCCVDLCCSTGCSRAWQRNTGTFPYRRGSSCAKQHNCCSRVRASRGTREMGVTLMRAGSPGTISSHQQRRTKSTGQGARAAPSDPAQGKQGSDAQAFQQLPVPGQPSQPLPARTTVTV